MNAEEIRAAVLAALETIAPDLDPGAIPEFDSSEAHLRPTPSNGAGFSGMTRKKPRYTDC